MFCLMIYLFGKSYFIHWLPFIKLYYFLLLDIIKFYCNMKTNAFNNHKGKLHLFLINTKMLTVMVVIHQRYHKIKITLAGVFCRHRKLENLTFSASFSYLFVHILICQTFIRKLLYACTLLEAGNTGINETQTLPTARPHSRGLRETQRQIIIIFFRKYSYQILWRCRERAPNPSMETQKEEQLRGWGKLSLEW